MLVRQYLAQRPSGEAREVFIEKLCQGKLDNEEYLEKMPLHEKLGLELQILCYKNDGKESYLKNVFVKSLTSHLTKSEAFVEPKDLPGLLQQGIRYLRGFEDSMFLTSGHALALFQKLNKRVIFDNFNMN